MRRQEKTRLDSSRSQLEAAVLRCAREQPQLGQAKAAAELGRLGHSISPSGVRYIWRKHNLETAYKRLKAIEKSPAASPQELTPGQREMLRRGDVSRKLVRKGRREAAAGGGVSSADRREHILWAAAELFVERGYGGTSIRDIARHVGLLPGSVYHYFPAKEDLFLAVTHEGFRQLIERVEQVIRRESDPWKRLEAACAEHIHAVAGANVISRITATGLFAIHEEALQRRLKKDRDQYERIFRELIAGLDLPRGTDRSLFRLTLFGALNWTRVWYRPGKKTPAAIARHLVATLRGKGRP